MSKVESNERTLIAEGELAGRPFRQYSDGTCKAATSDGWLSFQNLDALHSFHHHRKQQKLVEKASGGILGRLRKKLRYSG